MIGLLNETYVQSSLCNVLSLAETQVFRIQLRQRIVIEPYSTMKIYSTIVQGEKKRLFKST